MGQFTSRLPIQTNLDLQDERLVNVGAPTEQNDAARLEDVHATVATAGVSSIEVAAEPDAFELNRLLRVADIQNEDIGSGQFETQVSIPMQNTEAFTFQDSVFGVRNYQRYVGDPITLVFNNPTLDSTIPESQRTVTVPTNIFISVFGTPGGTGSINFNIPGQTSDWLTNRATLTSTTNNLTEVSYTGSITRLKGDVAVTSSGSIAVSHY